MSYDFSYFSNDFSYTPTFLSRIEKDLRYDSQLSFSGVKVSFVNKKIVFLFKESIKSGILQ